MVRKARLPEIARKLRGQAFWSLSYFVVSRGGAPSETVKAYVDNQRNPNRKRKQKVERRIPRKRLPDFTTGLKSCVLAIHLEPE